MVSEKSATDGGDFDTNIALHTDHRGLNKFEERNENYSLVAEKLIDVICSNRQAQSEEQDIYNKSHYQMGIQQHKIIHFQRYFREYQNNNLPPQVLFQKPVIIYDARGRIFGLFPEFIGSAEVYYTSDTIFATGAMLTGNQIFVQILAHHFQDLGLEKIKRGEWILKDHHSGSTLNLSKPWTSIFRVCYYNVFKEEALISIARARDRYEHGF